MSFGSSQNADSRYTTAAEPLSQSGQLIGWGIYGALLLIGFGFGIVTGYERPKTVTVAKAKEDTRTETPKTESKSTQKVTSPESSQKQPTAPAPKEAPISTPAETTPPKSDPPKSDPPKSDPTTPTPMDTTAPKKDPPPKKENPVVDLKPVSFKKDVLPILRTHCLNCHGATGKPKGDVDLRTLESLMKSPSENNKMLVPGKPDDSDFYTCITLREMPKDKPKPSADEMLVLKNWILTGGKE